MSTGLLLLWILVGWCGNEFRRGRRGPIPPPDPWPWLPGLLAAVGGLVGGWLFQRTWPSEPTVTSAAATAVGALAGGVLVSAIADRFLRRPAAPEARPGPPSDAFPGADPAMVSAIDSILAQPENASLVNDFILKGGRVNLEQPESQSFPGWVRVSWRRYCGRHHDALARPVLSLSDGVRDGVRDDDGGER